MARFQAVTKELLADAETPVSAYLKLCSGLKNSFLFESGENAGGMGRYSVAAWDPLVWLELTDREARRGGDGPPVALPWQDFISLARRTQRELACRDLPELPFVGALMGYLGYEAVRLIEKLPGRPGGDGPLARLCYSSRFVVFDHLSRKMTLAAIAPDRAQGLAKLRDMEERLRSPLAAPLVGGRVEMTPPPKERFLAVVRRAEEYIAAGDVFQVVLSDRFTGPTDLDPFEVYRWLRVKNPSPYMFFLNLGGMQLAGASPETLVKVSGGQVLLRPIAGTRSRSSDPERDHALERELLASEKERAEHVMLVDLARNDAGRVSQYGTVRVAPYMNVERFSHVMHITSQVAGRLRPGLDAWDAFMAGFPAGTVSGAPKVRAMEIINEVEAAPRGPYAGAVGRFGPGPEMDACIAIRMIQFQEGRALVQVGAGIVADSDPEGEYREITDKAAQAMAALRAASEERS
jgi:anthranilate synthase component 1